MFQHLFKSYTKRIISLMLLCSLVLGTMTPFMHADAADITISHDNMNTTIDLLTEVVSKNLAPYGIEADKNTVKNAFLAVGRDLKLIEFTDSETNISYTDQIEKIPVYSVIDKIVDDYNVGNGYGSNKNTAEDVSSSSMASESSSKASASSSAAQSRSIVNSASSVSTSKSSSLAASSRSYSSSYSAAHNTEKNYNSAVSSYASSFSSSSSQAFSAESSSISSSVSSSSSSVSASSSQAEAARIKYVKYDTSTGMTYAGYVMRTSYTYGDLLIEYVREKEPTSAVLYDSKITELIKEKVTTKKPDVKFSDILKNVADYAALTAQGSNYTEVDYISSFTSPHTITYYEYTAVKKNVVPQATLFIGTYLIDASVINDVYYRYAVDSMGVCNQQIMYYKSELDGGAWKDVISAAGLSDILPVSGSIADADLMQYRVTCVIGADGIPRNPDDGEMCDIFTMTSPYDMVAVPELVPIKSLLDAQVVSQDTKDVSNRYTADILYRLFNYDGVGDNKSMMIIRNKPYRDYIYDHPTEGARIIGQNPLDTMDAKVNITEDEIRYITSFAEKNLGLCCNMPQTIDRYPTHPEAFFDQLYAWAEYYGNNKFKRGSSTPRPTILPGENFQQSLWEKLERNTDHDPQQYMFIISGPISTPDQREFFEKHVKGTVVDFNTTSNNPNFNPLMHISDSNPVYIKDPPVKITYNLVRQYPDRINDIVYGVLGYKQTESVSTKVTFSQNWYNFCDLIYRYMDWLRNIYDIRDSVTYNCDAALKRLTELYLEERAAGRIDEADTLMKLMSRVDATRRAEIYYNMVYNENNQYVFGPSLMYVLDLLQDGKGDMGQNFQFITGAMAGTENYAANDAVLSSVEDAVVKCQSKYVEYKNLALSPSSTIIKKAQYELSYQILDPDLKPLDDGKPFTTKAELEQANKIMERTAADEQDAELRSRLLDRLAVLYNVEEGAIVDKTKELSELDSLIDEAGDEYADAIHAPAGPAYHAAAADPFMTKAALKEYLELQRDEAGGVVSQLQRFISGYVLRKNQSQGIIYINRRLDWAYSQAAGIKMDDPFGTFAKQSLDEHIQWLKDILATVKKGGDIDPNYNAAGMIQAQAQLLDALDNGDNDSAEKIQKGIDRNTGNGNGNGNNNSGISFTGDLGDTDDNNANPDLSGLIEELENKLMDTFNGETDPIPFINALGQAGDANLGNLKDTFAERGAGNDVLDAFDKAIKAAADSDLSGNGGGDDSGDTGDDRYHVTDADIIAAIEDALGKDFADLDDGEIAIVVTACTRYGNDYDREEVTDFGRRLMNVGLSDENPYFYHQFESDPGRKYVNLAAVDKPRLSTGYRYVKLGRKVTMTQIARSSMSGSYEFIIGSDEVTNRSGKSEKLITNTAQQTDSYVRGSLSRNYAYIAADDAQKLLSVVCEYVPQTNYAVFITTKMDERAQLVYDTLEETIAQLEEDYINKLKEAEKDKKESKAAEEEYEKDEAAVAEARAETEAGTAGAVDIPDIETAGSESISDSGLPIGGDSSQEALVSSPDAAVSTSEEQ